MWQITVKRIKEPVQAGLKAKPVGTSVYITPEERYKATRK